MVRRRQEVLERVVSLKEEQTKSLKYVFPQKHREVVWGEVCRIAGEVDRL